jgi:hypothetical protein
MSTRSGLLFWLPQGRSIKDFVVVVVDGRATSALLDTAVGETNSDTVNVGVVLRFTVNTYLLYATPRRKVSCFVHSSRF